MSEEKTIYEKLQKCRVELQSLKIKKSGKNSYSGFEYFELKDFLPKINEMFLENGLFSNFSMSNENATLAISNSKNVEENIIFTSPISELELKGCNKVQALGGMHTYLKRYLYLNALEIIEADMFDPKTGSEELNENKEKNKAEKKQNVCPKCGGAVNPQALEVWGCCSECKKKGA